MTTDNRTILDGVKNSPPLLPSDETKELMKYSYVLPNISTLLSSLVLKTSLENISIKPETFSAGKF
jgi:hypothetical protein